LPPIKPDPQDFATVLMKEGIRSNPRNWVAGRGRGKRGRKMYWRITWSTSENIHPRRYRNPNAGCPVPLNDNKTKECQIVI
jgi:hypothetical protein